ncbi:LuxR C-terminal-related transcriptional regulator [Devosia rhizoryzae]|uniref:histidine kinase n=1 Tax=Devosia rhizoryzae TaxID=2774137 RepID=A0ABX7C5H9_9HYPH|nr:LuxR C-terminal-related transcriptional regulator [Devosia rhizoryzae]QQR39513.1 PAS domain-containing protein [Devosia rhizoryzae]
MTIIDHKPTVHLWTPERQHFKAVTEGTSLMAWATDVDGHCFYMSPEWYRFTGMNPGTGLGFNWLMALHPDDLMNVRQAFFNATDTQSAYGVAYRLIRPDGSYTLAWAVGLPKFSDNGLFQGFFGTTFPIEHDQLRGLVQRGPAYKELSDRERDVLRLLAEGKSSEAVAEALGITRRTVESHVANAGTKLGGLNRVHTVVRAVRLNEI